MRVPKHVARTAAVALIALCASQGASAQTWLPPQGTLNLGVSYYNIFNRYHWLAGGAKGDFGHTRIQSMGLSASYSPTDRISVAFGIPYVRTEYHGAFRHRTEVDDGAPHATFTDLRGELHYQMKRTPFAFAPYLAMVLPTHHYETLGHAAPGRGLHEYWLGFNIGKSFDEWLPGAYVQLRYNYAVVQKVADVKHDRSNIDLDAGYFITPQFSVRALAFWARTHGGINVPVPLTNPLYPHHDQLAAERYLNVGGGVAWAYNRRSDVTLFYTTGISGRNGHKLEDGVFVGFGYSLGAP